MMMQTVTSLALQHQEQSVPSAKLETFQLAESSKAAFTEQEDPVNPFTLFGNTRYQAHLATCALQFFSLNNLQRTHASVKSLHPLLALSCLSFMHRARQANLP